jgi:pyrroloquinoline quinone biosynthesis protein E
MSEPYRPYTLIAELTYACPLRCVYCSNPVELAQHRASVDAATWIQAFRDAEGLGVMQLHFTGGEPLLRQDLEEMVRAAADLELYSNLITSGIPLEKPRLERLRDAGLDNVQLSFQAASPEVSDRVAGVAAFERKLEVGRWVKELGMPLTVNVVLHRANIGEVEAIVRLAEQLDADRLELANAQYVGWALPNRPTLLPTKAQIDAAREVATHAKERLKGEMEVLFVLPDYYSGLPKACMDGWGRRFIVIAPDGLVLPCHAAHTLPGLEFDRISNRRLPEIWRDSPGLNAFRGEAWMLEPCRTCEHRERDFGGCRCQAFHLTGEAATADPACSLSPYHGVVRAARDKADATSVASPFIYRAGSGV